MKENNLTHIISIILALIPLLFLQFNIGIELYKQISLSIIFPIIGLGLSAYSYKKDSSKKLGTTAIVINVISIIILSWFGFLWKLF